MYYEKRLTMYHKRPLMGLAVLVVLGLALYALLVIGA